MCKRAMLLLLLLSVVAPAQVVDTWAFSSPEHRRRIALSAVPKPKPTGVYFARGGQYAS